MDIKELKNKLVTNTLDDNFMVWILEDESSDIIVKQYINKIASSKGLTIKYIDSLDEISSFDGFVVDMNLYIFKTDEFKESKEYKNCIVLCNKTSYKNAIKIPKLQVWQFIDYLQTKVPGMNKSDLEWLATQYEYTYSRVTAVNYNRFDNDMDKIAIFPSSLQNIVFNELYESGEYKTVSNLTIFDLSNALIRNDSKTALEVLKVFDYIDSKPHVWLLSILLNSFKNIIDVQLNPKSTAESLGISDKQFYVIKKYNCGHYSTEKLINIYNMLTKLEFDYKFNGVTQDMLADYIVCKILGD